MRNFRDILVTRVPPKGVRTYSEHTRTHVRGLERTTGENLCARAYTHTYLSICLPIPGRTRQLTHLAPLNLCMSGIPAERMERSSVS